MILPLYTYKYMYVTIINVLCLHTLFYTFTLIFPVIFFDHSKHIYCVARPEFIRWGDEVRLYNGLKFVRSRTGSEAAKRKGLGHWLILDPVAKAR